MNAVIGENLHLYSKVAQEALDECFHISKFLEIWDRAKADGDVSRWGFPGYWVYFVEFAQVSLSYGYSDICDELIETIKKDKLPIPQNVKEHYGL